MAMPRAPLKRRELGKYGERWIAPPGGTGVCACSGFTRTRSAPPTASDRAGRRQVAIVPDPP